MFDPFRVGQKRNGFFPWVSPTAIRIFPLRGNVLENSDKFYQETIIVARVCIVARHWKQSLVQNGCALWLNMDGKARLSLRHI